MPYENIIKWKNKNSETSTQYTIQGVSRKWHPK